MKGVSTYVTVKDGVTATMRKINKSYAEAEQTQSKWSSSMSAGIGTIGKLAGAIGIALTATQAITSAVRLASESIELYNTQMDAQIQLATTLSNRNSDAVASYDAIIKKAKEIQSKGIYGDEAMITAGAEFSTYFTDTSAIEKMMDTLTNYAVGMTGGGEVSADQMLTYATNLGKIATGSFDAMTKKGFEFTEAQKAVIKGTATETQLIEALGDQYASMTQDMQTATVVADVINDSWANLYETMSATPEGRIIQVKNAIGDIKEEIGGQLQPTLADLYELAYQLLVFVKDNIGVVLSLISPVLTALVGIEMQCGSLKIAWLTLWTAVQNGFETFLAGIGMGIQNVVNLFISAFNTIIEAYNNTLGQIFGESITIELNTKGDELMLQAHRDSVERNARLADMKRNQTTNDDLINNTLANGTVKDAVADATSGIESNTEKTASNTAKASSTSKEELKWLRTLAERETVNRFTTAKISVNMGGVNNTVNSSMDLDGIADYLATSLQSTMASVAEGTHF